jgi:hypothetical protein
VPLPLFFIAFLFRGNIGVFHRNDDRRYEDIRHLAVNQDAIPDLQITELHCRGILQVLFPGLDAKDARCGIDLNGHFGAGIGG